MRCFISIDMPEEIRERIREIQDELPEFIGKKTEPNNLHLTMKFLGEMDREKVEEVKRRLRMVKFNSFEIEIDSIGVFSPNFIRIIWLYLKGAEDLQKKIDNALEWVFGKEERFMGHLTIARVKNIKDRKKFLSELNSIKIPKINFNTNNFRLKRSTLSSSGPSYDILEEYPLL